MKGPIKLFNDSLALIRSNAKLFAGIYAVQGVVTFVVSLFFLYHGPFEYTDLSSTIVATFLGLATGVLAIFMSIALIYAVANPKLTVRKAYTHAQSTFWWYLLLSLAVGLLITVGFLFFIIPGVLFFVWFAFSYYFLVLEHTSFRDALKKSKALTTGRWWAVFGRLALLGLFVLGLSLLSETLYFFGTGLVTQIATEVLYFVLNGFITIVSVAYTYLLYKELVHSKL